MNFKSYLIEIFNSGVDNSGWLTELIFVLDKLHTGSDGGRDTRKYSIKLIEIMEKIPDDFKFIFESQNVKLGRVTADCNVMDYLTTGKTEIYCPNPSSFFKITSEESTKELYKILAEIGVGFFLIDSNRDIEIKNGLGIIFELPKQYIKYIVPFNLIAKLAKKLKIEGIDSEISLLLRKSKFENEIMVILNDPVFQITSKNVLAVVERLSGKEVLLYTNEQINSGVFDGYPYYIKRTTKL